MNKLNLKHKKARIFLPLLLLLIPLVGMLFTDEIKWSLFDFIVMGGLILIFSTGIYFVTNKTKSVKNRLILIAILVMLFLLIWGELAVGIFGTPFAGN